MKFIKDIKNLFKKAPKELKKDEVKTKSMTLKDVLERLVMLYKDFSVDFASACLRINLREVNKNHPWFFESFINAEDKDVISVYCPSVKIGDAEIPIGINLVHEISSDKYYAKFHGDSKHDNEKATISEEKMRELFGIFSKHREFINLYDTLKECCLTYEGKEVMEIKILGNLFTGLYSIVSQEDNDLLSSSVFESEKTFKIEKKVVDFICYDGEVIFTDDISIMFDPENMGIKVEI